MSYLPEIGYRTVGVRTQIPWPLEEQTVDFRGRQFHLLPGDKECARMIRVRTEVGFDQADADKLIFELLSSLSWAEQRSAITDGGTWSTIPHNVGRANLEVTGEGHFEYLVDPSDEKAKLALALYREGMSVNMTPYKVLGFFKVINVIRDAGKDQKEWIHNNLQYVTLRLALERIAKLKSSQPDIANYLYESGRCAVAHAYRQDKVVNPDDPADLIRLHEDLPVIQELARIAIERDLGVKSEREYRKEHLYELEGFRVLLGVPLLDRIKQSEQVSPAELPIPRKLSLRVRGKEPLELFQELDVKIEAVNDGIVTLLLSSVCSIVSMRIQLDFKEERLLADPLSGLTNSDDGTPEAARKNLEVMNLFGSWYGGNGILELYSVTTGRRLGRTRPYMPPVNSRFPHEAFDAKVYELQQRADIATHSEPDPK